MKLVKIDEIFDMRRGVSLALNSMTIADNGIPFVSRRSRTNGVAAFVEEIDIDPNPAHTISVAGGGSVLESFYQPKPYYSGVNLLYLVPKRDMSKKEMLFYCVCIRKNKYKYNFGREAAKTLGDIKIPHPDEVKKIIADYSLPEPPSPTPYTENSKISLNVEEWKNFKIGDLFLIEKCKCSNATELLEDGEDIFYIGAKKSDNGVMKKVNNNSKLTTDGNGIVFIGDGQGSVGYSLYQEKNFIGSTTLNIGYHPKLNKYNALFLVTILDLERPRYSYGRKYNRDAVENTIIKLPAKMGKGNKYEPDWQFMEDYIKSLPYSSNLASNRSNS